MTLYWGLTISGSQPGVVGKFSDVTLLSGQSLKLSFLFRMGTSVVTPNLRFGLYNDGGTSVAGDYPIQTINSDYGSLMTTGNSNFSLSREAVATDNIGGGLGLTSVGSTSPFSGGLGTTSHSVTVDIARSGSNLQFVMTRDGVTTIALTDSSPLTYTFNQILFFSTPSSPSDLILDNVSLQLIPEPQSLGFGFGVLFAMVVFYMRKRSPVIKI